MNNYSDKSNKEINFLVAKARGFDTDSRYCVQFDNSDAVHFLSESSNGHSVDYCNSWNDIGPIMEEYKIDLIWDSENWYARPGSIEPFLAHKMSVETKNPKRAAAIVFLMINNSKGVE